MNTSQKMTYQKNTLEETYELIEDIIDDNLISLNEKIKEFIFQDIDYYKVISVLPQWVVEAGISPEFNCTKALYEKLRERETNPIFGKYVYFFDLCAKISAIQDRLSAVCTFMHMFYEKIPKEVEFHKDEYTSAERCNGEFETEAHILLNNIFVVYASVFDIISKIAVEEHEFIKYDFNKYKKMKSSEILFKRSLNNIDPSLKGVGMLFSQSNTIKMIETFRNEYVHNGPWDFRCSIYNTFVEETPADVIIFSPDLDEFGNFITSGSRNKFYAQKNRINKELPNIIKDASIIVKNTINQIGQLYNSKTTKEIDETLTKECLKAIADYYLKLK